MRDGRAEALLIFCRRNKRTDHCVLLRNISKRRAINLPQPKNKPGDVRITSQVAKILGHHEGSVVLSVDEASIIYRVRLQVVISEAIQNSCTSTLIEKIN